MPFSAKGMRTPESVVNVGNAVFQEGFEVFLVDSFKVGSCESLDDSVIHFDFCVGVRREYTELVTRRGLMFWMFDIRWICATVYVLVFHVGPGSITSPTALAFATIRLGIYAVRRLGELASISNVGTFDKISIICRGLGQTDFLLWSQLREYS